MSLREIASEMKKKGRGPDTELVHMAPREVAGLRALAKAYGGEITTNPDTGLPEAGFLEAILPTLVGAGLAIVSGGTLIPVLAAAATGAMTNKENPWMGAVTGAMGGFGGAGIANAAAGAAGASAAETAAASATTVNTEAAAQAAQQQLAEQLAAQQASAAASAGTEAAGTAAAQGATEAAAGEAVSQGAAQGASQGAGEAAAQEMVSKQAAAQQGQTAAQQTVVPAEEANYTRFGRGVKNIATGEEGAVDKFVGKPATATSEATGMGGWRGAGDLAMKSMAPALAAQQKPQGGGTSDARGLMNSVREGTAQSNAAMRDLGTDEEFNAARRRATAPGGVGAGMGELASFNRRPWYYEQQGLAAAQGGVLHLNNGGLAFTQTQQTNNAVMPYADAGDSGLGLAALASRIKRYQMPIEDQVAAASAASVPAATHAPLMTGSAQGVRSRKTLTTGDEYIPGSGDGDGGGFDTGPGVSDSGPNGSSNDGGASAAGPGDSWAQGGLTALAKGGLAQGGFVFASDVVSALGNGSTAAGLRALSAKYGDVTPLHGAGDGLSDSIPTSIEGKRPARVADGEAYVSPKVVTKIGGGDHAKGAKVLYGVMERVRKAAHGKGAQQRKVNPARVLA